MAQIINSEITFENFKKMLHEVDMQKLVAQELVTQGALNALANVLARGCDENTVAQMLMNVKVQTQAIRTEIEGRNMRPVFKQDQTPFN